MSKSKNTSILSFLIISLVIFLLITCSSCGGGGKAIEINKSKKTVKEDQVESTGIRFKDDLNGVVGMGLFGKSGSINNTDMFDIIDAWTHYETTSSSSVDVYIDMSGGLNHGIEQSQSHMETLTLTLKNNATYYKIGGSDSDLGVYEPEALDITDYTTAYSDFSKSSNFTDGRSKLKAGLSACVNNNDNITVFVTDFLLDEGIPKTPQSLHSSIRTKICEDGNPWAINDFASWFDGNNILEIIAVEHTLSKGYGCRGNHPDGCKKQIYYMIFTPAHLVGMNKEVQDMVADMIGMDNTKYLKIDPLAIALNNNDRLGVGNDVNYDYNTSRKHKAITLDNYQLQFVPINIPMMKERMEDDDKFTMFSDVTLINNLYLNDAANDNSSPYSVTMTSHFYDATEFFYQLCAINKNLLQANNMVFNPDDYPGQLSDQGEGSVDILSPRETAENNNLFSFNSTDLSVILNKVALQNSSYFGGDAGHAKLYLCDIVVDVVSFNKYEHDFLQWKFHREDGYLDNLGLIGSLNRALQTNKNNYKSKILYSYLIALNDNN